MYDYAGDVDENLISELLALIEDVPWVHYVDTSRDYWTWHPKLLCPELPFEGYVRLPFFLKIRPGGKIHRHTDQDRPCTTYHIPVQTNSECWCFSSENDSVITKHLDVGKMYTAIRTQPHWSNNDGEVSRIHLIVPVYEDDDGDQTRVT